MAFDANDEGDKKILADAIAEAVTGLKSKNEEKIGENRKLKDKIAEIEAKFSGIDPDAVRELLSKAANDEEARLIASGKVNEVVEKRIDRMKADYERQLREKDEQLSIVQTHAKKYREQTLAAVVRDAGLKAGMRTEALDDAVYRARAAGFTVDEEGNAVLKQGDEVKLGKDGKTPLQPSEWVESIREAAPHLWPQASGGGAAGGGGSATKKFSEMSESERAALYKKDVVQYERARDADKSKTT